MHHNYAIKSEQKCILATEISAFFSSCGRNSSCYSWLNVFFRAVAINTWTEPGREEKADEEARSGRRWGLWFAAIDRRISRLLPTADRHQRGRLRGPPSFTPCKLCGEEGGRRKERRSVVVWQERQQSQHTTASSRRLRGEYFRMRGRALIDRRLTFKGDNSILGRLVWLDRSVNLILRGLQIICHHIMTCGSEDYFSPWQ